MASREFIESVDGGRVEFDSAEEDEADAFNAETFGLDDNIEPSGVGFFDIPIQRPSPPIISFEEDPLFLAPPPGLSPPPPPPPAAPETRLRGSAPVMSIHAVPVRVLPTPFTVLQCEQALTNRLDVHKWSKQQEFPRSFDLMTRKDKEYVTKIQLNQMVALSGSSVQNIRGKFTLGNQQTSSQDEGDASNLGKRLYASVYHPRKLLSLDPTLSSDSNSSISEPDRFSARAIAEKCFDLLLDVDDVDEYIATLHPLAEDKINEAIIERTELIEKLTSIIKNVSRGEFEAVPKLKDVKDRAINAIAELVQPHATAASEAEARRSLIFRRVPEAVQGFYIDMLEAIVGNE